MIVDETSNDLDIHQIGAAIYAKRYWILIPTLLAFVGAAIFVTIAEPRYTANTQILLENQESYITRAQRSEQINEQLPIDEYWVGSQVSTIMSRDVAREVIEKLGLVGSRELDPIAHNFGALQRTLVLFGLMRNPMGISPEDRAVDTFEDRLSAYSPVKTQVVLINFWAHDPVLAARIANEIATVYLERQANAKRIIAKNAADALATQIENLQTKLVSAANDVESYRAANGLLVGSNNMTVTTQQFADLNTELSHARTEEADSQAKAALIRQLLREGRVSEIPDVANNDLIRRVAEQRVTANAQLALESGTLLPLHPRIRGLKAEIADLDAQLRLAADNIAVALENDSNIAAARVANLKAAIGQQKDEVSTADVKGVRLHELEQFAQGYRDQLNSATAKYQEAMARQSGATPADARVIAEATPPDQPSFPNKPAILALVTLSAFVLALASVVSLELLAVSPINLTAGIADPLLAPRRDRDSRSIVERLREFATARKSHPEDAEQRQIIADPHLGVERFASKSTSSEGLNIVATRLDASEGAAEALIEFARNLAGTGRPIIVDLDARDRQIVKLLSASAADEVQAGLTDLLAGSVSFADVIHRDTESRLHFVPYGSKDDLNPADLDVIFDALARTYDFVLLAAPASPDDPMTKVLAPYADVVILAVPKDSDQASAEAARAELNTAGAAEVVIVGGTKQAA